MTVTVCSRRTMFVISALLVASTAACTGSGSEGSTSAATSAPSSSAAGGSRTSSAASPSSHAATSPGYDPLTGGRRTTRPAIAVKLENTAPAMPQYGLSGADVVFVEKVEGNLTRLMPIYQSHYPKRVEPVRSARRTDLGLLPMLGRPLLVYSGVASQVRRTLQRAPIVLASGGRRDPGRAAPHNLYADVAALAGHKGVRTARDIGLRFARHDNGGKTSAARTVSVPIGADRFTFRYSGGAYLPSWNGRPYTDAGAHDRRVTAANVLVLSVRSASDGYRDPAGTPVYRSVTTGSGKLTLYRDGRARTGTWRRASAGSPFQLRDADGHRLRLRPGKSWILLRS